MCSPDAFIQALPSWQVDIPAGQHAEVSYYDSKGTLLHSQVLLPGLQDVERWPGARYFTISQSVPAAAGQ
jgi:hypothetical protein